MKKALPLITLSVILGVAAWISPVAQGDSPQQGSSQEASSVASNVAEGDSPLKPVVHKRYSPFWTTAPGYYTTIKLQNNLLEEPLTVSGVLFLGDGTAVPLDSVELLPHGNASIIGPVESSAGMQFSWQANPQNISVPSAGNQSPEKLYKVTVTGAGNTKFRATITNCDGASCSSKGVIPNPPPSLTSGSVTF